MNTTDTKIRIEKVTIKHMPDENPDLSYLGEYSDKPSEIHIDRQERGDMGRNEMRYFNLGCGDADYIEQDYKRAEAYNRGDWLCIGIRAEAEVSYDAGNGSRRLEKFTSGGLWGVESDSGKGYIAEIESAEIQDLKAHLEVFGIEWNDPEIDRKGD